MTDVAGETKVCTSCQTEYPATSEFFSSSTKGDHNGLRCYCKPCAREKAREYQKKNPDYWRSPGQLESRKRSDAKWYAAHGPEYHREWKRENRDHINELRMVRRQDPAVQEKEREYALQNASSLREAKARYRTANPDKFRSYKAKRRAGERNGTYTSTDIARLWARQEGRCLYCDTEVGADYHVDHYIPLSKGGTNWPLNLVLACPSCNLSKSSRLPSESQTPNYL